MTNREIAAALFLSPKTIEHHVTAALRKTGVRTRTELAVALTTGPQRAGHRGGAGSDAGA
jgi:DNA-binding NarL/FixJ family response regulator